MSPQSIAVSSTNQDGTLSFPSASSGFIFCNFLITPSMPKFITSKHHGFRKGMLCETQLIEETYDILNKGKGQIYLILLEFSKTFDVAPHHCLLLKFYMYGITGKGHRWIIGFLGNTSQGVDVNGSKSERRMVNSDVPQSTVLGSLLFLIYFNDIGSQLISSFCHFADDNALYGSICSKSDSIILQKSILKLQKWAKTFQMAVNVNKCKLLYHLS